MFRHTCKLDLETKVLDLVYAHDQVESTTYMRASSAYGLTGALYSCCYQCDLHSQCLCLIVVVQNVKSDDGNYEDIPSNTHEGNEPTYTGVVN